MHIDPIFVAPIPFDGVAMGFAVAFRAAWVGVDHDIPLGSEDLEFLEKHPAVLSMGTTVDFEDGRVLLTCIKADWLHYPRVDFGSVWTVEIETLHWGQINLVKPRIVKVG